MTLDNIFGNINFSLRVIMKKLYLLIISILIFSTNFAISDSNFTYSLPNNYKFKQNNYSNSVPTQQNDKEQILFIVDLSNSMNERLGRSTKIDVALSTMKEILQLIPKNIPVGLRVYGHKTGFTPHQSCTASELIAPITTNNTARVYSQLSRMNAVGWTPITYSLKQAAYFDFKSTQGKKRIILLSDGGENCDESPCDFVIELLKYRDDIKIDVIAFAIGDRDANNQLKCVSLVTSGKFYNANTAAELKDSLKDSLNLQKEVQGVIIQK